MPFFRRGNSLGLSTEEKKEVVKDDTLPFVTPTQLDTFGNTLKTELSGIINGVAAEMRGVFQGIQQGGQRQEQRTTLPEIHDLTDEEYQEALSNGDVGKIKIREQANGERIRRESNQQIQLARQEVTPILESMSGELSTTILASLEYYPLFKRDVDSLLQTIPAANRNRSVIEHVYHSVCGRPENIQKIQEYRTQQRTQRETEEAMASGTGQQRRGQREKEVTFEQTFGEQISNPTFALHGSGPLWQGRRRGYDAETYSRDIGFKDKNEFARFSHAVMSVEDCPECMSPIVGGKCAAYCKMNKMRG